MAFANNIQRDMTAADARATAGQESWMDIYPDDFDFEQDAWDYAGEHRIYVDTHGNAHFVTGRNPFSGELAQTIAAGEKDGILARKAAGELSGPVRDTRSRYGEPKEWDHVIVGLSREDAAALGPDGVKDWAKAVIRSMQDSPAGDGKRQMLVTGLHLDTDNPHVQFLLHRIPVDEVNKTVGASFELSRNSEAASQMKQLNTALEAAGLPMIHDFRMGAFSVTEPRAVSAEELARGAERVREAGGVTPPDLTTGPIQANGNGARERVSPEMRHLDSLLSEAVKRQKEAEAQATAAATAVAAAQHAKAALEQYEAEAAKVAALSADLEQTRDVLTGTQANLAEALSQLQEEKQGHALTSQQLEDEATLRAKAEGQVSELLTENERLSDDLGATQRDLVEARTELAGISQDLANTRENLDALTAQHDETVSALATSRTQAENEANRANVAEAALAEANARGDALAERLAASESLLEGVRAELGAATEARRAAEEALSSDRAAFAQQMREMAEIVATLRQTMAAQAAAPVEQEPEIAALPRNADGMQPVSRDVRRVVEAAWPEGATVRRGLRGTTVHTSDGAAVRCTSDVAVLTQGRASDDAIRAMITHAQRQGWSAIEIQGTDAFQRRLTRAAREAGIEVTNPPGSGYRGGPGGTPPAPQPAPGGGSAPAQAPQGQQASARSATTFQTKEPSDWTKAERREAEAVLKRAQDSGKFAGVSVDKFGESQHRIWKQKNPEQAAQQDATRNPGPKGTDYKPE